jgi:subtilisin family serine protease
MAAVLIWGQPYYNSGTSFSCPILAGCAACLWQAFPTKTAQQIKDAIMISADHFWTPDNNHGYGIPNFYNAYLLLATNYNGNILRLSDDAAVYPSPFTSQLNVSLYSANEGNRTIELFDMLGRKVYGQQVYVRANTFEIFSLPNLDGLNEGEYFVRIDQQKQFTHPVVKIK